MIISCKKDEPLDPEYAYDIILIAGQSNTHQGIGLDAKLDAADERIKQLGRFGLHDKKVITACEPLEHGTPLDRHIGFGLTFAKEYLRKYRQEGRRILILPCGHGSTSFNANHWNKGDKLYNETVARTRYALSLNSGNRLVAILWHQGESDVGWPGYQQALDTMIVNMRKEIGDTSVFFLLGGMVPYWVSLDNNREAHQAIIADTPHRIPGTAYVNPNYPAEISSSNYLSAENHYDAPAQRLLGKRYFAIYDSLRSLK